MSNDGALSGITVLDLSRLLPGPFCTMILADHGARVISVEDKRFMADDLFIPSINRNKEHVSLNLKTPEGKEIFYRLVDKTDILLEGFRPGVVHRLGVDYDTIRSINPKIIYCSITGYGQTGPHKNRAGHDVNFLGHSGVLDLMGEPDRPPSIPGVQIADIAGGGMNAAIGILLALWARERTGEGQHIDIAMTDGMASLLPLVLFFHQRTGDVPRRGDSLFSHRFAFYNTYETADGRHISIGAVEYRFWKQLCEYLGVPEYVALQHDEKCREEILDFMRDDEYTAIVTEFADGGDLQEYVKQRDYGLPVGEAKEIALSVAISDSRVSSSRSPRVPELSLNSASGIRADKPTPSSF